MEGIISLLTIDGGITVYCHEVVLLKNPHGMKIKMSVVSAIVIKGSVLKYKMTKLLLSVSLLLIFPFTNAFGEGGITIEGTRIIYPEGAKQTSLSISNTSDKDSFLVQSWVENQDGSRTGDFIVVPPLYLSGPKDENLLRLILTNKKLPQNRESLYYFVAKGIPSVANTKSSRNVVMIAVASRIKLFVRPSGLALAPKDAPGKLQFFEKGNQLVINNPTPYYITTINMRYEKRKIPDVMIAPFSKENYPSKVTAGSQIEFSTINDFGAITPQLSATVARSS